MQGFAVLCSLNKQWLQTLMNSKLKQHLSKPLDLMSEILLHDTDAKKVSKVT